MTIKVKIDAERAWKEGVAALAGQREIMLAIAGAFFLLPSLMLYVLKPLVVTADDMWAAAEQYEAWIGANLGWLLLVMLVNAFGRLSLLILLLGPARPTVGEAMRAGAALLALFALLDLFTFLIVAAGLSLFLIPGFYLIGRLALSEIALVAERLRDPVRAAGRAWRLSSGNGWRIFGVLALMLVAARFVGLVIGLIVGIVAALLGGTELTRFLLLLIDAGIGAALMLMVLLMLIGFYRQLAAQ